MRYNPQYNLSNLRTLAAEATEAEHSEGMNWYLAARRVSHELGAELRLKPSTVAGVIAALSPRNAWEYNKPNAMAICRTVVHSGSTAAWKVKVNTFDANKEKSIKIASSDTIDVLKGQKVQSFVHNIVHEDSECITVDTHAFNAACGEILVTSKTGPTITPKRYREVSALYHKLARELGIRGYQAQAIVWVVWRRKHA